MGLYDVFTNDAGFDVKEWAAEKQAKRRSAYDRINAACLEITKSGDALQRYLDVQGRFDRYSVNNALLIAAQKPNAIRLKGKDKWREENVYVDNQAKGIVILMPGKEYIRADGTKATGYDAGVVYDITETSLKNRIPPQLPCDMKQVLRALLDASPVRIALSDQCEAPAIYDDHQGMIFVRTDLDGNQLFNGLAKEIAAAVYDRKFGEERNASVFQSYCTAYMLSTKYGVDTKDFHFNRAPAEFTGLNAQDVKAKLETMREVMRDIQKSMYLSMDRENSSRQKAQMNIRPKDPAVSRAARQVR